MDVHATNVRTRGRQQRIIPGIRFTCNGTLTKWTIGAQRRLTQTTNHLQLQIWRQRSSPMTNIFDRIHFSDITDLNATDDLNVYEYIPNPPLQFQTNDLLGLFQPHGADSQEYYQQGGGPQNSAQLERDSAFMEFNTGDMGVTTTAELPLVTVEVNGKPYQ